jgi:hypothetical protein
MTQLIVKLEHLGAVRGFSSRPGFCRRGARCWFAAHDLDWNAFRHHGIDAAVLIATGDALALAVVDVARAQQQGADHGRQ